MTYYNYDFDKERKRFLKDISRRTKKSIDEYRALMWGDLKRHQEDVSTTCVGLGYCANLTLDEVTNLATAAYIHDIGKTELDTEKHWEVGADIVRKEKIIKAIPGIDHVILNHHEKYDGTGPNRLSNRHIPLQSKIIAVASDFDTKLYDSDGKRTNLDLESAFYELKPHSEKMYDPDVLNMLGQFISEMKNSKENTLNTLGFAKDREIRYLLARFTHCDNKGWKIEEAISYIKDSDRISEKSARVFANFVYNKAATRLKTFSNENVSYHVPVIKNKKKGTIKLGKKGKEGNQIIVYTKKVLEDINTKDYICFKEDLWKVRWIDQTRFMLVR